MANDARAFFQPNYDALMRQAEAIRQQESDLQGLLGQYTGKWEQLSTERRRATMELLASEGKLSGTNYAKAVGQIEAQKTGAIADAYAAMQSEQAAARNQARQVESQAGAAKMQDIMGLVKSAAGLAAGLGGGALASAGGAALGKVGATAEQLARGQNQAMWGTMLGGVGDAWTGSDAFGKTAAWNAYAPQFDRLYEMWQSIGEK